MVSQAVSARALNNAQQEKEKFETIDARIKIK